MIQKYSAFIEHLHDYENMSMFKVFQNKEFRYWEWPTLCTVPERLSSSHPVGIPWPVWFLYLERVSRVCGPDLSAAENIWCFMNDSDQMQL